MKRIINYTKNKGVYVFQEEGTHNKIKIPIEARPKPNLSSYFSIISPNKLN